MKIEQIYTGCLAQGAYYIESNGEAAVIDPLRETKPYITRAGKDNAKIKYVFETHFHADFVSGHLDLAKATGAKIIYGPLANPDFKAHIAKDNEVFQIGNITLQALHTPGHTMESTCYLLKDENGKETALFTGDTLFIGDVGRPDLAQKSDITQDDLAGYLFESLRTKVMTLPDELVVYPAHGAGSSCGKNMSKETFDTLGHQKETNYALRSGLSKSQFITEVTEGLQPPPAYFPLNVQLNKEGYESLADVMEKGARALSPDAFEQLANETGALILDTRSEKEFPKGFIPNSINIGLNGQFAPWVGALIPDIKQAILIVAPVGKEEETVMRLARVGYDHSVGYLEGGFDAWKNSGKETDTIETISPADFVKRKNAEPSIHILDVRKTSEYQNGHLKGAVNIPLDFLNDHMNSVIKNETVYLHCQGGYRSMIFTSILRARGFENIIDVEGGYGALVKSGGLNKEDFE